VAKLPHLSPKPNLEVETGKRETSVPSWSSTIFWSATLTKILVSAPCATAGETPAAATNKEANKGSLDRNRFMKRKRQIK
jgi:hypothetical protein